MVKFKVNVYECFMDDEKNVCNTNKVLNKFDYSWFCYLLHLLFFWLLDVFKYIKEVYCDCGIRVCMCVFLIIFTLYGLKPYFKAHIGS